MKKIALTFIMGLIPMIAYLQPTFSWVKTAGSASNTDYANSVAVDNQGNVYSTGRFYGTVDFDPGPGIASLTAFGNADVFVTKFNAAGSLVWVKQLGGTSIDLAYSIACDGNNNVIVTGNFQSTFDCDPGAGVSFLLASNNDVFIVKLNSNGNLVWGKSLSGTGNEYSLSISTDASNNVYTTGYYTGSCDFDPGPLVFNITSAGGSDDLFISKLDENGNFIYAKGIGVLGATELGYGITADNSGNAYITGRFASAVDFDPGVGTTTLTSTGADDIFVLKLNSTGDFVWARNLGGTGTDYGRTVAVDASSNVYVGGYFSSTGDFDPGVGTANLTSAGGNDAFVAKLNSSGNYLWAKGIGSTGNDFILSLDLDASSNAIITGRYYNTVDFDPGAGTFNLTSAGDGEIFLLRLDASGNFGWAKTMGGATLDLGFGVCYDQNGNIYTAGQYESTSDFNPPLAATSTSAGLGDIFLTKHSPCVSVPPATPGSITGATSICGGTTQTYSVATVAGATSYYWYLPNGWTGTSTTNSITVTAGTSGGTISVSANNACGSSSLSNLSVTVNNVPAAPGTITGNFNPCLGSNQTYNIAPVAGATSYTWTSPSGWSGSSTTTSINIAVGILPGNITVTANNSCGSSLASTLPVTSTSIPPTPTIVTGSATVCNGSSQTYTCSNSVGAASYVWTLPAAWTGSSSSTTINTTVGNNDGNISVQASNVCGTSPASNFAVDVINIPTAPGSISGNISICEGVSEAYNIASVNEATSYTWTLPSGWSGSSTSTNITLIPDTADGIISVTASNICGTSSAQTLTINVNSIPAMPDTILGNIVVCSGSNNIYSITPVPGATSYTWTLPGAWSGTSTSDNINTIASSSGGNILVTSNNLCGSSVAQILGVTVNSIPATPGSISGVLSLCSGSAETYTIDSVFSATSYNWSLPSGWIGSSSDTSITLTSGVSGGNITVEAVNACGTSAQSQITVVSNQTPVVNSSDISICSGQSANLFANTTNGNIYWHSSLSHNDTLSTGGTYTTPILLSSVTYFLSATDTLTGCSSLNDFLVDVTVNPSPIVTVSLGTNSIVSDQTGAVYQWLDCNNLMMPFSGEINQTFIIPSNGSYAVEINLNGCVDTSSCELINNFSINETLGPNYIIYPNPTKDQFATNIHMDEIKSVEIIGVDGKVNYIQPLANVFNVEGLKPGIYIVKFYLNEEVINTRLIIAD